jgi:Glycosyl transferase family 2
LYSTLEIGEARAEPTMGPGESPRPSDAIVVKATPPPILSVVVVAFGRRDFVLEAVDSVRAQSVPRESYEILVVTNLHDPDLDRQLRDRGAIAVYRDDIPLGPWILAAVAQSRGEVLLFLDDDDLFAPEKLATVGRRFEASPRLGYYHNGQRYFTEAEGRDSESLGPSRAEGATPSPLQVTSGTLSARTVEGAWWAGGAFNPSSISVRRRVVVDAAQYFNEIRIGVGPLLFYAALLSGWDVLIESAELTRYRVHAGNMSGYGSKGRSGPWARQVAVSPSALHDAEVVGRLLRDRSAPPGIGRPLEVMVRRTELLVAATRSTDSRRQVLVGLRGLIRASFPGQLRGGRPYLVMGALRLVSPRLSRRWLGLTVPSE